MPLGSIVHSSNINTFKSIYYAYFHSIIKYVTFGGGGNYSNSRIIFTSPRKSSELWLMYNPEIHVEVWWNN